VQDEEERHREKKEKVKKEERLAFHVTMFDVKKCFLDIWIS
jgi:hypothetical protein